MGKKDRAMLEQRKFPTPMVAVALGRQELPRTLPVIVNLLVYWVYESHGLTSPTA